MEVPSEYVSPSHISTSLVTSITGFTVRIVVIIESHPFIDVYKSV